MRTLCALLLVLALAGCDAPGAASGTRPPGALDDRPPLSALTPLADPRAHTGPSTAVLSQPDVVAVRENPVQRLPVTVTDFQGTSVTVTDTSRVLAFDRAGTLSATVFGLGLGKSVVGRDVSTGFPAAQHLPLITTGGHQLNAEAVLGLRPTVVITDTTVGPWDVVLQLRDSGIPVVVVDSARTMDNTAELTTSVAAALGVPEAGRELAASITSRIDAKKAEIAKLAPAAADRKPRVVFLYVRGQSGVYYMFGKGSGADSLIGALGAVDVATEVGWEGMRPINPEALAKAAPDVILMMTAGLESVGGVDGAVRIPGVAQTPAAAHRRFIDMSDHQVLGFGPLTPDVLDALARALYAPEAGR
ncbi:hemin ABC transporter substrate-binding protein [Umezawaea endophytica]|uniref:ABC transporter substrate-binding protein n=1 Tax=Umezawaea endophytica TaxID=1654476 RepID=A0A9X3ACR3_9PSEU|nr:ABC transporter substrate-binding protein [Umezawaea endophytica]MCS7475337.1 ABC transporter substrate-binding protein [Umezawaea endophytica]